MCKENYFEGGGGSTFTLHHGLVVEAEGGGRGSSLHLLGGGARCQVKSKVKSGEVSGET